MKVLFAQSFHPLLGIECLSAYLKAKGHTTISFFDPGLWRFTAFNRAVKAVGMSDFTDYSCSLVEAVHHEKPGLVCFSVNYEFYHWARAMAAKLRENSDVPIVFGGIHPTSVPEIVLKDSVADFAVIGEGEGALFDLVEALESGSDYRHIPNLAFCEEGKVIINPLRPLIADLDALPFPDKDLFGYIRRSQYPYNYHTMASRNCVHRCTYCCHSFLRDMYKGLGKYVRQKSVARFIDELEFAKKRYAVRTFLFHDEVLCYNKKWFSQFAQQYKRKIGRPYFCWLSPDVVDSDRVDLLKQSGCIAVEIGIQTAPDTDRQDVLNRKKQFSMAGPALDLLRQTSIYTTADTIVGLPGQTEQDVQKLIRFFLDHPVDHIAGYWLRYYPKIRIIETAREMGILNDEDIDAIEHCLHPLSFTKPGKRTSPEMYRLGSILLFTNILGRRTIEWILTGSSRMVPSSRFAVFRIASMLSSIKARLFGGKRRIPLVFSTGAGIAYFVRTIRDRSMHYFSRKFDSKPPAPKAPPRNSSNITRDMNCR